MLRSLCKASNRFTLDLFCSVACSPQNLFISGYSVNVALAMLALGSEGDSLQQLKETLRWDAISDSEGAIVEEYCKLAKELNAASSIILLTANSVWSNELRAQYVERVRNDLKCEAYPLDSVEKVNTWVEERTQGLIPELIQQIDKSTLALLVNAIYFKGSWESSFSLNKTTTAQFLTANKEIVNVPMMHRKGSYNAVIGHTVNQALELPYTGEEYSMVAILPRKGQTWSAFMDSRNTIIKTVLNDLRPVSSLKVSFPKFKIEYGVKELKGELKQMGINDVFGSAANLSRMSNKIGTHVDSVLHKAVCEVNEEGTEAAAVTVVALQESCKVDPAIQFNKPFMFFIRQKSTNLILFIGTVENPLLG